MVENATIIRVTAATRPHSIMAEKGNRPLLLDKILSGQAQREAQVPLIAYPRGDTVADFELLTAHDLDILVDRAAKYYSAYEVDPVRLLVFRSGSLCRH